MNHCNDIAANVQQFVERCGIETGLLADIERFFPELAPADRTWLHNDLQLPRAPGARHLPGGVAGDSGWPAPPGSAAAVERVQPRERAG